MAGDVYRRKESSFLLALFGDHVRFADLVYSYKHRVVQSVQAMVRMDSLQSPSLIRHASAGDKLGRDSSSPLCSYILHAQQYDHVGAFLTT